MLIKAKTLMRMFLCVLALVWFVMLFWEEEEEEEEGALKERWDGTLCSEGM